MRPPVARWGVLALALLVIPPRCSCETLGSFLQELGMPELEQALRAEGFLTHEELVAAQLSVDDMKELGLGMKQRKKLLKALAVEPTEPAKSPTAPAAAAPDVATAVVEDDGEWSRLLSSFDSDGCEIDSVAAADLTLEQFEEQYRDQQRPVLIRNLTHHLGWPANERWRKEPLLSAYGDRTIVADSQYDKSVTLGYDPSNERTVRSYVESFTERHNALRTKAPRRGPPPRGRKKGPGPDELVPYVFDGSFLEKHAPELRDDFSPIPVFAELTAASPDYVPYFFLGAADTGLWFHKHGEAWNAVVHGKKRWLLYPPGYHHDKMFIKDFIGVDKWLAHHYPKLKETALKPIECVQNSGDVVYLPARWLHAIVNLQDSIGITVDHLHEFDVVPLDGFHFRSKTKLDDSQLSKAILAEKRECGKGADSTAACVSARWRAGLLSVYRFVQANHRKGQPDKKDVVKADKGVAMLQKLVRVKELDGVRARAAFVLGLTMSFNSVSVEMGKEQAQALSTILRAIDSGNYHPVGCVELYWAVHSLSLRSHALAKQDAAAAAADEERMVAFGYEMLADKDITEGENGDNRHAVLLLLAEFHSKHSEWDKLVTCCEQAVELNPLHEQSISMLAGAYKRLGKVAEEEATLRRAASVAPWNNEVRNRLVQLRREL